MSIPGAASPLFLTSATAGAAAGYQIDRSLRFNDDDGAKLTRTFVAGNQNKWTWSGWVKRSSLGTKHHLFAIHTASSNSGYFRLAFNSDNTLFVGLWSKSALTTDAVYRDLSAWMHIVLVLDLGNSTAADKIILYVNGVRQSVTLNVGSDQNYAINSAGLHNIGSQTSTSQHFDGYMAEVHFVDGQALAATDFGEYDSNNVWQPKEFAGVHVGTTTTATGALPIRNTTGDFGATAASGFRTDANASNLFLALPLNTDTNDVSNSINSSSTTKTTTNQSTATSNTKSQFYGASSYWNANSDGILVAQSGSELVLGTGDFTIEFWFYDDSNHNGGGSGRCYLFDNRIGGSVVGDPPTITGYVDGSATINYGSSGGGTISLSSSTDNKWIHFAAVRNSGTTTLYINGSSVGSHSDTTDYPNNGIGIGRATDAGYGWAGYIQDFRVYKTAKYTSNFVPVAQNNSFYLKFADNSSNAALGTDSTDNSNTWTVNNIAAKASTKAVAGTHQGKAGISFNGTDAEINISADADVNPGSGVFTLECYAYALSGGNAELGIYDGSPGGNGSFVLRRVGAGTLMVERHNTAFDITGAAFSENTWHHVAVTRDSSNNVRLFVDGNQSGSTSTGNTHNYQGTFRLGRTNNAFTNGYISNLRLIKGTCLYTSNFTAPTGNLSNVTNTKLLMAQSTTSATAATVKPSGVTISGSGDSSIIDSLIDTPTNYTPDSGNPGGNYATFSPIDSHSSNTFSQGNLEATNAGTSVFANLTMGFTSGKWYCEIEANGGGAGSCMVGIVDLNKTHAQRAYGNAGGFYMYQGTGGLYSGGLGGSFSNGSYGSGYSDGDIIGIGLDMDNGNVRFYVNGSDQGQANTSSLAGALVSPAVNNDTNTASFKLNTGQRPFAYTPPTGHKAMCTTNFADPTIPDGSTAFDATLWTGNGGTQTISGLNHSPDFIWHKIRSIAGGSQLYDSVRGTSKRLRSDSTAAESTLNGVTAFNSDGWTMTAGNNNNETYVSWTWDAGASTVSNTDGSITSSVRANQSAGFSIVSYQGNGSTSLPSIGHGLNTSLGLVIIKNRDGSQTYPDWYVKHKDIGDNYNTRLNLTAGRELATGSGAWYQGGIGNLTSSSVITFVTGSQSSTGNVNTNGNNYIAYCFAPVEGFSAFGSYEGNGSDDGPFVFTGFKVAWLMIKNTSTSGETWTIYDSTRDVDNPAKQRLLPNSNDAESVGSSARFKDLLSNGFKIRGTSGEQNTSGDTYIYAAFAEHPFSLNGGLAR